MPPRRYNVDIEIDREKQTARIEQNGEKYVTITFERVAPKLLGINEVIALTKAILAQDGYNPEAAIIKVYGDE